MVGLLSQRSRLPSLKGFRVGVLEARCRSPFGEVLEIWKTKYSPVLVSSYMKTLAVSGG